MFVGTCSGCIQVPTPVYYWNPYSAATVFAKKSPFQISEILQMTQNSSKTSSNTHSDRLEYPISVHSIRKYESFSRRQDGHDSRKRTSGSDFRENTAKDVETSEVVNYSKQIDSTKCSLPSALEPLQALCSAGLRGYGRASPGEGHGNYSTSTSTPPKDLKFGINRILADDFGKDRPDKENATTPNDEHRSQRPCECTYEGCHMYQQARFPSHALSAVHALQPPRYPNSPSGSDVLPGPYSVLNTDVHIGAHAKRKRSWSRAVFSNLQRKGLEKRFEVQKYVTKPDRRQLAAMLGLTDAQVKVWFQNRRMKWRHAQQQNDEAERDITQADDNSAENCAENCTKSKTPTDDVLEETELVIDEENDMDELLGDEEQYISDNGETFNVNMEADMIRETETCASTDE